MIVTELQLEGLCCANEAAQVESRLHQLEGVERASVHPLSFRLRVVHSGPSDTIASTVRSLGYGCSEVVASPRRTPVRLSLLAALVLALAGWVASIPELYLAAVLLAGGPTLWSGAKALLRLQFDMNALTTLAVVGAVLLHEWQEAAAICLLYAFSQHLESATSAKTRDSISDLMSLKPTVVRLADGTEVAPETVTVGARIEVRPGEQLPLDGVVVEGSSSVDTSALTGESMPRSLAVGDKALAGSINGAGRLILEVSSVAEQTLLAKVLRLVEEAERQKAPTQRLVDRFARIYTPLVLVFAVLAALLPWLLGAESAPAIYRGLTILVLACPCALVISVPVALVAGLGQAARHGLLIKSPEALEMAADLSWMAFDKTGTLTQGKPEVTLIECAEGVDQEELLKLAAAVEQGSEHPLAQAVLERASGLALPPLDDFKALPGLGAEGMVEGRKIRLGKPQLFELESTFADCTEVVVFEQQRLLGRLGLRDRLRPEAAPALRALHPLGLVVLTGDSKAAAAAALKGLPVERVESELLPDRKLELIGELQTEGSVAMVGDGINDAPALAQADLAIAMGSGTDVALETAQIALLRPDLRLLPFLCTLSRATRARIRENIVFSLVIKLAALLLVLPGWLTLWMAVLSDTGTTVLVVLNSLRLSRLAPSSGGCCGAGEHACGRKV